MTSRWDLRHQEDLFGVTRNVFGREHAGLLLLGRFHMVGAVGEVELHHLGHFTGASWKTTSILTLKDVKVFLEVVQSAPAAVKLDVLSDLEFNLVNGVFAQTVVDRDHGVSHLVRVKDVFFETGGHFGTATVTATWAEAAAARLEACTLRG